MLEAMSYKAYTVSPHHIGISEGAESEHIDSIRIVPGNSPSIRKATFIEIEIIPRIQYLTENIRLMVILLRFSDQYLTIGVVFALIRSF